MSCSIGVTGRRSDLLCVQHICDKAGGRAWWAAALESPHPHVSTGNSGGALSARGWKGERRHALDLLLAADEHESFMNRRLGTTKRYCPSSAITLRRHCVRNAGFSPGIVYRVCFPPCAPPCARYGGEGCDAFTPLLDRVLAGMGTAGVSSVVVALQVLAWIITLGPSLAERVMMVVRDHTPPHTPRTKQLPS